MWVSAVITNCLMSEWEVVSPVPRSVPAACRAWARISAFSMTRHASVWGLAAAVSPQSILASAATAEGAVAPAARPVATAM